MRFVHHGLAPVAINFRPSGAAFGPELMLELELALEPEPELELVLEPELEPKLEPELELALEPYFVGRWTRVYQTKRSSVPSSFFVG